MIKLSLYADDTTVFIRDDSAAVSLLSLLEQFGTFSGLKKNKSKTEGLWLGLWKNRLGKDKPFGISWPKQYVSTLRVVFAYERYVGDMIKFDERLVKLKKTLNFWCGWHLTILGRIAVIKALALSKLVYNCSVLEVPVDFAKNVNSIIFPFIWNFKPDKIKRNSLIGPISKSGLNMVNFVDVEKSLKAAWVNRYRLSEDSHWCVLLDPLLAKFGGPFLFQCNYDLKMLGLKDLPPFYPFYKSVKTVWQELHSKIPLRVNEMKDEILWNNRFIKIGGKTIYYRTWVSKGIRKVNDLDSHGLFFSFENFKSCFGVRCTFLEYSGLLAAIPKHWKSAILDSNQTASNKALVTRLSVDNVSAKRACLLLAERSFCPPLAKLYLKEQNLNPSAVFKFPSKITIENKLRSFQFKLIQNIIPTNQRLWKMNIKASPQCEQCNFPTETTIRMFFECPAVKLFWKDVLNWWNFKRSESINPSATEILYGYEPESTSPHTFNHYLLIARYYIYLARNKSKIPKLEVFIIFLETKI